jgi:hypothetical protein
VDRAWLSKPFSFSRPFSEAPVHHVHDTRVTMT